MKTHHNILLLVVVLAAACSTNASAPGGSGGSGGTGGTGILAQQLCPGACKAVKTCYARLDTAACETQCGKELAGDGYLIPEFAKEYFQKLKDAGTDSTCSVTHLDPWEPPPGQKYDAGVNDPAVLKQCIDDSIRCLGRPPTGNGCFLVYYIFNTPYLDKKKACFALSCADEGPCMCDAAVPWLAWVAIPQDHNDPFYGSCPPGK